jgi:hypothetical protein
VANYRGAIDRYITPNLGRANLHEIDAATLDTLHARLRATGGKCRHCWKRIRRGEPALRAGVGLGGPGGPLGAVGRLQASNGLGLDPPQPWAPGAAS